MNTPTTFQLECLLDRVYENSEASEDLWDKGFLESVLEQRKKRDYLSESQIRTIDKIQAKYTDVAIAEKQHWKENWSDYHRDLCLKVAHYYKANPPYFGSLVSKALSDKENFFFIESDFLKFTKFKKLTKMQRIFCLRSKLERKLVYLSLMMNNTSQIHHHDTLRLV